MQRLSIVLIGTLFLVACTTVPITGRKQVHLLPESDLVQMSLVQYNEFLESNQTVNETNADARLVKRVGEKIAAACEDFLNANGQGSRVEGYNWEFNLVDDPNVNAWCMPGGKVVFYTGILPICAGEEGIAVVMGHEIAHAVARHGNERMSQGMVAELGGTTLGAAMDSQPEATKGLFNTAYGMGSQLGILAYSRNHESEADKMGLVFMAKAGYDPESAVSFWKRMSDLGGSKPPEMLSTHPSDETRIQDILDFIPEAKRLAKQ